MARPKAYKGHNPLYGHACAAFSVHSATLGFGGRPWCLHRGDQIRGFESLGLQVFLASV